MVVVIAVVVVVVVAVVIAVAVVVYIIVVAGRTAIPTAFATGPLFIVLLVSRGIDGDYAEPVAQVGSVCIKRVLARRAHNLVAVLLLK